MVAPLIPMEGHFSMAALFPVPCLYGSSIEPYGGSLPHGCTAKFWGLQWQLCCWASPGGRVPPSHTPWVSADPPVPKTPHLGGQWGTFGVLLALLGAIGVLWGTVWGTLYFRPHLYGSSIQSLWRVTPACPLCHSFPTSMAAPLIPMDGRFSIAALSSFLSLWCPH